jgi:hypothetical protein
MPTLIATVGSPTANAYITVARAKILLDLVPNADAFTGDSVDGDAQIRAVVEGTTMLDVLAYKGLRLKSKDQQALSWPRAFVEDPDGGASSELYRGVGMEGVIVYLDSDTIPLRLERATARLALEIMKAGTATIWGQDDTLELKEKQVDVLTTIWADPQHRLRGLRKFPQVWREVYPLLLLSDPAEVERA